MDAIHKDMLALLWSRQENMVEQLHDFCRINSGTENLQGLNQMLCLLKHHFSSLADETHQRAFKEGSSINMAGETTSFSCGDALFFRKRSHLKNRILLIGHMDTVYPKDHAFQTLRYLNKNTLNGPGVADMKGGLVVLLHALTVFEEVASSSNLGWDIIINGDEEIGSPVSSTWYEEIAQDYLAAFIYEPALDALGTFAKNRSGSGKLTLVVTGKSAHVGRDFKKGLNAITHLAKVLTAIQDLNQLKPGVILNVGKIAGGGPLNVVPDKAVAKMDIRIRYPEDEVWVTEQLQQLMHQFTQKGFSLNLYGSFLRPVKRINQGSKHLFARLKEAGRLLNLNLHWKDSGGCCDGNNFASKGIPVLDSLGVRGGHIHSEQEYVLLDSLVERAALSAFLLSSLNHHDFWKQA